ncbi:MAG: hypothetical protein AB1716_17900 [Planctomycetota bacterium]
MRATRPIRAPAPAVVLIAALLGLTFPATGDEQESRAGPPASQPASSRGGRHVKLFDFDERPRGNFEDTPMYWRKLAGPGLPAFSVGCLDEVVGHDGPPSFRFTVRGGSIAYEYGEADLVIDPDADYLLEAWVRTEGLEHAVAFMGVYLVDRAGERIEGSELVSTVVGAAPPTEERGQRARPRDDSGRWQRVELPLRVEGGCTAALRIQLWVAQAYACEPPGEAGVDPILREEVDARVWFDDLAVVRVPRLRLRVGQSGGVVPAGEAPELLADVHNTGPVPLRAELALHDGERRLVWRGEYSVGAGARTTLQAPAPLLAPGLYCASARLALDGATLAERTCNLVVLVEARGPRRGSFGIDLGRWRGGDPAGAAALATALGCGSVRVEIAPSAAGGADVALRELRELIRALALAGVETIGVLVPPAPAASDAGALQSPSGSEEAPLASGDAGDAGGVSFREFVRGEGHIAALGPLLAYLGTSVAGWQLGAEAAELRRPGGWTGAEVANVRRELERVVSVPRLVVPRSVLDAAPNEALVGGGHESPGAGLPAGTPDTPASWTECHWVPGDLATRALPWHLDCWPETAVTPTGAGADEAGRPWLCVGGGASAAELAQRIVLAAAANPGRIYVPAPFRRSDAGGRPSWAPTAAYIPLRTLIAQLDGTRAVAGLALPHDATGVVFARGDDYRLVLWTWRNGAEPTELELCAGVAAAGRKLHGGPLELSRSGARVNVPVTDEPLIVEHVAGPLLMLEESLRLEPDFVQPHQAEPRPRLVLQNPWPAHALVGSVTLQTAPEWRISPNPIRVQLGPGEVLSQALEVVIPPRQIATEQPVRVEVALTAPEEARLQWTARLRVGLADVAAEAGAYWAGADLIVRQTLRNLADRPLSFDTFCQAAGRARLEAVAPAIPPGGLHELVYRLPGAAALAGTQVWVGLREIGGPRALDQLADVPVAPARARASADTGG